jgi:alcohol dehydrogenase class IV
MDAFVQLLESYVSIQSNELTDALSLSGMRQAADGLIAAYQNGDNLEARSKMAYAALMSGVTLTNAGLGVVHGVATSLGGFFDIPHGVICGTLLGAATRMNIHSLKEKNGTGAFLEKYARAGALVSQREYVSKEIEDNLDRLIQKIDHWISLLHIPKLGAFGVSRSDVDKIASHTENKNNPVKLSKDKIKEIISERI